MSEKTDTRSAELAAQRAAQGEQRITLHRANRPLDLLQSELRQRLRKHRAETRTQDDAIMLEIDRTASDSDRVRAALNANEQWSMEISHAEQHDAAPIPTPPAAVGVPAADLRALARLTGAAWPRRQTTTIV